MDILDLKTELSFIECEKCLLVEDAKSELLEDAYFLEETKKRGILERLKDLIRVVKEWFQKHFSHGKRYTTNENVEKKKKIEGIVSKLKSNAKNKKLWIALGIALGTGVAVGVGVHMHNKKNASSSKKKEKREVGYRPGLDYLEEMGNTHINDDAEYISNKLNELLDSNQISAKQWNESMRKLHASVEEIYNIAKSAKSKEDVDKLGFDTDKIIPKKKKNSDVDKENVLKYYIPVGASKSIYDIADRYHANLQTRSGSDVKKTIMDLINKMNSDNCGDIYFLTNAIISAGKHAHMITDEELYKYGRMNLNKLRSCKKDSRQ